MHLSVNFTAQVLAISSKARHKRKEDIAGCCARPATGQASDVPPSAAMNCRRPMPIVV
jgi:hypothetical protein